MRVTTLTCKCFFCQNHKEHPKSHEGKFERSSNLPSDEPDNPGPAVEFCTLCGHQRLVKEKGGD